MSRRSAKPRTDPESHSLSRLRIQSVGHFARMQQVHTVRPEPTDWLLVWATRGSIQGTLKRRKYVANAGEAVLMPPDVAQDYWSPADDGWEWLFAHFDGPASSLWADRLGLNPVGRLGMDVSLRGRWIDLVATHESEADLAPLRLAGLLADLAGTRVDQEADFAGVRRFVQEHLADPLRAADLAEVAGLSVPHFNRRFREAVGESPMKYVARQRISRAQTLLRGTDQKLVTVAAAVGFDDPYHFSRVYKQHTGRPPSQERL
ncbi:MAG: AraC family transcriptional regulator [Planctomycetota bacterium]